MEPDLLPLPRASDEQRQAFVSSYGSVGAPSVRIFGVAIVVLSMNKLELPAEVMPVPCPLADKSPIGFWIRQGPGTALGSFPHFDRAGPDPVSSLRLWRCFFQPAGTEEGSAWGTLHQPRQYSKAPLPVLLSFDFKKRRSDLDMIES